MAWNSNTDLSGLRTANDVDEHPHSDMLLRDLIDRDDDRFYL
jgi:hypothetical protein